MNGAEWLARSLKDSGQTHFFFVDAVLRRTLLEMERIGVQPVLAHTEKAAVYMADAYGRISGRPGVVAAQSVGTANLAAGLQDAWLGRSPVLALTGHKPIGHQHRNAYQEVAHAPLFAPVTKHAAQVHEAADLPRQFRQAWSAAVSAPPRPVHLDLNGLMGEFVERSTTDEPPAALGAWVAPAHRPMADAASVQAAARALLSATKLAIVAGDGAALSGCGAEVLALAEALRAPIATSLGARGMVPTRHPLHVGVVGNYSSPPANQVVHAAELVCFIGCDTGDQVTHTWRVPKPGVRVVQLDADPLEFHRSYAAEVTLLGDPRATLAALVAAVGTPARDGGFLAEAQALMAAWRREVAPRLASDAVAIDPARLCAEITRALPADGILVADTGYSGIWTGTLIELEPSQTYLRAAGSLGWAFPAALGAKCAAPDRKVIAWSGDGALYYHLPELETAKRRGIAVVLVVNNNSGFGQGWPGYLKQAGNRPRAAEQVLRFGPTDFAAIAGQFGLKGIRVERPQEIAAALAEALASNETVVVDVATDIEARAPEPWTPQEGA
ncbi:acetolactate synthase large subunit [Siccirubricoccus deserti]|uniref:Thiamine pyrophosphate-binding protein n=1 Tax=Siccirubricoccus deserti TaxID=2013562 RepID=A0A9X0QZ85_9PROT|nr:thiamine pyrophosphate-binding protein [Siccirubricoccus deserti]MBC4016610.1 thiamine pyrophosphate-binding protein [Siccirubricoccus deserti]GGC50431.1 acetolactate synthase large subunit [Siccirubricoccus deserti]